MKYFRYAGLIYIYEIILATSQEVKKNIIFTYFIIILALFDYINPSSARETSRRKYVWRLIVSDWLTKLWGQARQVHWHPKGRPVLLPGAEAAV